jgi:hypothetical protein
VIVLWRDLPTKYLPSPTIVQADGKQQLATGPNPSHGGDPMAQAAGISTAIRQLVSRGRLRKSTSTVRLAHTELIAALAGNAPHPIYRVANPDDLDARANHLEKVFAALDAYVAVIIGNTAQSLPTGTLDRLSGNLLQELSADLVGIIRKAAEEMREDENWSSP